MLRTTYIEVHILPVFIGFLRNQCLFVVGIHIAQVVGRRTCKARHREEFQRENRLLVDIGNINNRIALCIPSPFLGVAQRGLAVFGGFILVHLGQLQRQALFGNHIGHAVFVINGERLTPIALAREDGIAQTVVHLYAAQALFADEFLGGGNSLLHGQAVQ